MVRAMNFESFLNEAWSAHGKEPARVAESFPRGFELIEQAEQIGATADYARLGADDRAWARAEHEALNA